MQVRIFILVLFLTIVLQQFPLWQATQAFWHVDHQNFDSALGMLLDPLVHIMDMHHQFSATCHLPFVTLPRQTNACPQIRNTATARLSWTRRRHSIYLTHRQQLDQWRRLLGYNIRRNKNQRNSVELMKHLLNGSQEMCPLNFVFDRRWQSYHINL